MAKSVAPALTAAVTTPPPAVSASRAFAVDTLRASVASKARLAVLMDTLELDLLSTSACSSSAEPWKDVKSVAFTEATFAMTSFTSAGSY